MRDRLVDLLTGLGVLVGWGLLTYGVVRAIDASWVWYLSAGVLILGLIGLRPLLLILWLGVSGLETDKPNEEA